MSAFLGKFTGLNGLSDLRSPSLFPKPNPGQPGGGQTTLPDPTAPNPVKPDPVDPDPDPVDPVDPDPDPDPVDPVDPDPDPDPDPVDPDPEDPSDPPVVTEVMQIAGGRVTNIQIDASRPVAQVEITSQPGFGHASVNPDKSISLVMSGESATGRIDLDYTITYEDGSEQAFSSGFNVGTPSQEAGWGAGEHYMLETGGDGHVVVETGENHRDVYIGGTDAALSRADIARMEGLDTDQIDRAWLIDHPDYGGSEAMALDSDAGIDVWYGITNVNSEPSSHWLRLESGHEYGGLGQIVNRGAMGESELHPLHITSWGEGPAPVLLDRVKIFQLASENVVFSGVTLKGGVTGLEGENILFDDVTFTGDKGLVFQDIDTVTIRDSSIEDIVRTAPVGSGGWSAHQNRIGGLYTDNSKGLLIENSFIHHNGWTEGYDGTPGGGQPPSMFSHNIYFQNDTTDVTFRDNVVAQGASFGAQLRGGAFVEDNAFIDNNAAFSVLGGNYREDGAIGNYSLVSGNLVTSAAYKIAPQIGGVSLGQINSGYDTTLKGNIVAHLADPDDPADFAAKQYANDAAKNDQDPAFDDTIIYNWRGSWGQTPPPREAGAQNIEGRDLDRLDTTTIQRYAEQILGRSDATIDDLMDHLSKSGSVGADAPVTADTILAYFREGFGVENSVDTTDAHRFAPEEISDGVRWDNRLNWNHDVLPGQGDDVDLGGNRVAFGSLTARVGTLDLGPDGELHATSGRLAIEDGIVAEDVTGGRIELDRAGQIWTDGVRGGPLEIDVAGGRFVNTGDVDGQVDLRVSDNGQAILGTDDDRFDLADGGGLHVEGSHGRVGFDGDAGGTAVLRLAGGELSFTADADGLGHISEFRSGAFGDMPEVRSGIDLGQSTLRLDLGTEAYEGRYVLLQADEIVGRFGQIEVAGLRDDQDLRFEIDHENDVMDLVFGKVGEGEGQISLETLGQSDDAQADADLWAALTAGQGSYDETPIVDAENLDDVTDLVHV